jgi:manganese/zinc/iron transport system substrate-binding protein
MKQKTMCHGEDYNKPAFYRMLSFVIAMALLIFMSFSSAYARDDRRSASDALTIIATTSMIADMVREIGGEYVSVRALMGAGVDPHAYRQTRSDIVAMTQADLVFAHGLFLEAQMETFLKDLSASKAVITVTDDLPRDQLIAHADYDGKYDPHIWMDTKLWAQVIPVVEAALSEARPDQADAFAQNAAQYRQDIEKLRNYQEIVFATIPEPSRILITAHDAFGYFGKAYGFDVMGIQGISTESEAGLQKIKTLVDVLVARNVKAVFVESSVSDRHIRALIEGAQAQGHAVRIGGELFSDAMGSKGTYEGSYIGMIDHNTTMKARALGGQAPERGMQDRLSAGS